MRQPLASDSNSLDGLFQSTHSHGVRPKLTVGTCENSYFNPRTHTECDVINDDQTIPRRYFNPRTHTECDARRRKRSRTICDFNPRTHTECDRAAPQSSLVMMLLFQSTHSHGVRPETLFGTKFESYLFQSTHSHGVRLAVDRPFTNNNGISIHALTRSATRVICCSSMALPQFQSTHSHGVRLWTASFSLPADDPFQSTHSHGVRPAPAGSGRGRAGFQSTHSHGVRPPRRVNKLDSIDLFQSTHSHGVRRVKLPELWCRSRNYFNPRTHTECDCRKTRTIRTIRYFNPRTHTECDGLLKEALSGGVFQSTHSHGVRRCNKSVQWFGRFEFQSTHSHGVRQVNLYWQANLEISIHALTRSATILCSHPAE